MEGGPPSDANYLKEIETIYESTAKVLRAT